jgi:hypothetical protein
MFDDVADQHGDLSDGGRFLCAMKHRALPPKER